ncbi:MAG: hypothetical protein AB8B74_15370 [Crocinitomicaceae bacterium]
MKSKINQSDLKYILHYFAPANHQLFIFDPYNRLNEDTEIDVKNNNEESAKVLVNLSDEIIQYKNLGIEDFDMIIDFGKSNISDAFTVKHFEYKNNADQSLRWVFSKGKIKTALNFYNDASLRAKMMTMGIRLANILQLGRFIGQGKFTIYSKQTLKIELDLNQVEFDDYAIFTGSEGYGRTAVVALSSNNTVTHFAKLAYDTAGRDIMKNEKMHLLAQGHQQFHYVVVPEVVENNAENLLITTNVTLKKAKRSTNFLAAHSHFIATLFHKTKLDYKISNTPFWGIILNNISVLEKKNIRPELKRIVKFLKQAKTNINANRSILTTLAHGDFTPWNLKFDKDNIYVYDWEYASFQAPVLFDLIHFHFQNGIFIKKHNYAQILKEIEFSCQEIEIKYIIEQYNIDLQFYIKLYLLKVVSFQVHYNSYSPSLTALELKKFRLYETALSTVTKLTVEAEHRSVFIGEFYNALKQKPHAMLKFVAGSFDNLSKTSDLDIAVLKKDGKSMVHFAKNHLLVSKSRIIRKSFMTIIELFFEDGSFLSIDLIHQFKRKGLKMMEIKPLLNSVKMNPSGIMVPSKKFDLEYAFLFYTLNGALFPVKYYKYFKTNTINNAFNYINNKYNLGYSDYSDLYKSKHAQKSQVKKIVFNQSFQNIPSKIFNTYNYFKDTLKSIINNRGFIITLSGVDGAGKSTVLSRVHEQLQTQFRKEVVLLRHRPAILPILSAVKHGGSKKAEKKASERLPRTGTNNSKLSSSLRFAYYYTDYLIGQLYVFFKYIIRGKIVLYDRYYFDFIADCERSNIRLNKKVIRTLYAFVAKPKLNILLWADAKVIYKRKQELEPETITRLTQDYKKLFKRFDRRYKKDTYKVVKNVDLDFTVDTIVRAFTKAI